MGTHTEVRLGSLVAAAGMIWTAKLATTNYSGIESLSFSNLPRGPLEVCGIGILIWLHALWRRSVQVH